MQKIVLLINYRKIKHNERSKLCLSNNSKSTEANVTKLHRKIEHNEKVCCAQKLGSYAQGQGNNQVRRLIAPKIRSE